MTLHRTHAMDLNDIWQPPKWPARNHPKYLEKLERYLRFKRDCLLAAANKPLLDQLLLRYQVGQSRLSGEDLVEIQDYAILLHNLEKLPGYPHDVQWPDIPAALRHVTVG